MLPYRLLLPGYSFFFSGSAVVEDEEALGAELLALESLDFGASLEPDPLSAELDELGAAGLVVALPVLPTEAEPDSEPGAPDGGELLGEVAVLELDEPGLEALLEVSPPRSHAARPKASATAAASIESFMCPPWLGYKNKRASCAPGLTP